MTQEQVARAVGVPLRSYQRWEDGDSDPRGQQIVALAKALDFEPGWFFEAHRLPGKREGEQVT